MSPAGGSEGREGRRQQEAKGRLADRRSRSQPPRASSRTRSKAVRRGEGVEAHGSLLLLLVALSIRLSVIRSVRCRCSSPFSFLLVAARSARPKRKPAKKNRDRGQNKQQPSQGAAAVKHVRNSDAAQAKNVRRASTLETSRPINRARSRSTTTSQQHRHTPCHTGTTTQQHPHSSTAHARRQEQEPKTRHSRNIVPR